MPPSTRAGYGHEGILEESPLVELRRQFDVKLFGAVALIEAVLPVCASVAASGSSSPRWDLPSIAYYCRRRFALEGIPEMLASDVRPFALTSPR